MDNPNPNLEISNALISFGDILYNVCVNSITFTDDFQDMKYSELPRRVKVQIIDSLYEGKICGPIEEW